MFDVLIAGGDVYDGTGGGPVPADVGVRGDRVVAVGRGRVRRLLRLARSERARAGELAGRALAGPGARR
jgi:predicted amidohydrolase YtcJ